MDQFRHKPRWSMIHMCPALRGCAGHSTHPDKSAATVRGVDMGIGIVVWLILVGLAFFVLYLVVKSAVCNGINESRLRQDMTDLRKAIEKPQT
jgi:hypothetical protein